MSTRSRGGPERGRKLSHGIGAASGWAERAQRLLERGLIRIAPRSTAGPITLSAFELEEWMAPLFFAKVQAALALIGEIEPRRLPRIERDIRVIGGVGAGASYYANRLGMIVLSWHAVLPQSTEAVAMTIIHEATHARIYGAGIRYPEPLRARIERICVEEEAAFALRLPNGEVMAKEALARLERPWWTPDELHESAMERGRALEVPEWMMRLREWRHRRRKARRGNDSG